MTDDPRKVALPGVAGKRALVTGGSRGIGRATVLMLARAGAAVGFCYRSAEQAAEEVLHRAREAATPTAGDTASESGRSQCWAEAADLSREEEVERLFRRVDETFGGLDLFVGNAGIWNEEAVDLRRMTTPRWRRMMEVNLTSVYLTTRAAATRMEGEGRIVLVSSTAAQRGEPGHSHYAASKGGVVSFAKSLAGELGPEGITVNVVAPGWVDTDMSAAVLRSEALEGVLEEIPLGRVAEPVDVAGPIAFLLSDLGRHVHGEVLNVNGGAVLCG